MFAARKSRFLSASLHSLSLALVGAACLVVGQPGAAQAADLSAFAPCPTERLPKHLGGKAECATLTVLEDAKKPKGRKLELPLLKIPSTSPNPGAPVFVLNGGPGAPNFSNIRPAGDVQKDRDIYYLGYRGADGATAMDCPEIDAQMEATDFLTPAHLGRIEAASAACAKRLARDGFKPANYTMFKVIDDLEAARKALKLDKINLFSVSYGTRVAQFYARRHPGVIHRSIMVEANPPGRFVFSAYVNDTVLRRLSELCRQDPACAAQTPDLRATILKAISLRERGLSATVIDGRSRAALFAALYGRASTQPFVKAAVAAEKGDTAALEKFGAEITASFKGAIWGDLMAKGGLDGYRYAETAPTLAATADSMGSPMDLIYGAAGKAWPQAPVADVWRRAAYDDTETLVINGDIDVAASLLYAEAELMPYLRRGQLLVLKDYGHRDYPRMGAAFGQLLAGYYRTGVVDRSLVPADPYRFEP